MKTYRRKTQKGQAVVEMALLLPIMLILASGFIGLMMHVQAQQQMDSAVSLASSSALNAPLGVGSYNNLAAQYAADSFNGTLQHPNYLVMTQNITCTGGYMNNVRDNGTITCSASATLDYSKTPLAPFIWWKPTVSSSSTIKPSDYRQCAAVTNQSTTTC